MVNKTKKIISLILSVLMIFSSVSVALAADTSNVTVKIVSFMRGEQSDLRSSELLEARVEGYDGNVRELTYKWKSTLGTYLYVYNSHNMYNINNTDGEIEIHNTDKNIAGLSNMVGRTYNKEFAGTGYAWASVYGASIKGSSSLVGKVTVEVYDKSGNLLCSDSHEGKYQNRKNTGFVMYNLDSDMDNVVIGLFEGEKRNVKDLLGESAIVHITCVASTVDNGKIISGSEHVKLTKESGDYFITGTTAGTSRDSNGDAQVDLDITKDNCKFHNGTSGDAVTTVFVFKKPTTSTTTTTLTLTGDLDERCDYFIGGVEGTKQDDGTIIFTGLTPNTSYTVEVRGEYKDNNGTTKYAYAYVYDTTKPVYQATVYTYLDGQLTDIADIHSDDVTLYLHEDKENAQYIELSRNSVGTYSAAVTNGIYLPWHIEAGDHYHKAREYKLIIENANGELDLHHYSVAYDTNGGAFKAGEEVAKENFTSGKEVKTTTNIPVREGYAFAGWEYNDKTFAPDETVTTHIASPIVLTAKWEKEVNVTINVEIDHRYINNNQQEGYDHNENKDELTVSFLEQKKDSPAFIETGDVINFAKESVTDGKGNAMPFNYDPEKQNDTVLVTKYTATAPTYTGLLESSYFGVALSKSGYTVGNIEKIKDEETGNWTINIPLTYRPDEFNLEFSVKMAEDVPTDLYPDAVIIKIACWDSSTNKWEIISQQRTTETAVRPGVRVDIDENTDKGSGSYPVWMYDANNNPYGYRAVVAGFIYDKSTVIVPSEKNHIKDENNVIITYTDGNYTATMGDVNDGQKYSTSLFGAYYNEETKKQQGTLDGVISVEKYNVTFDAQGGKVNGKDKDIAENQYYVPGFSAYVPEMENHNFLGWYTKDGVLATENVLLTEDITLYAKWDRILKGSLIVDGYYKDDKGQHIVNLKDRATHALVELKEITNDGTYNIAGQTVEINWVGDKHFSEPVNYMFTGLDREKTYRIAVYLMNYEALYQNSTTVINNNGDLHDDYNDRDFEAVYPKYSPEAPKAHLETEVNTFLHFEPEVYFQHVEVDATRIGEGFRPSDALVEYLGKEAGTENDYGIIVQHKVEPFGVEVGMGADGKNDGIGNGEGENQGKYGCKIWKKIFNGNLYDYQANLTKLSGKDISDWPVIVTYGDSVRWSPYNQAPTDALKVTVIPNWYYVHYNWNGVSDETGNDIVYSVSRGHIWSHESYIDYSDENKPVREGYDFCGWYADPECTGEAVTKIAADVTTDTTVYAKWEKKTYSYTVNYLEEGTDNVLSAPKKENASYADNIKESAIAIDGYTPVGETEKHFVIDQESHTITFYYTTDKVGGEGGNKSDGIPDKYQKKVIFRVVNGTWADGKTSDIINVLELKTDGEYDINGTASVTAPVEMKAFDGFINGSWDVTPPASVSGTNEEVYTFSFVRSTTPVEPSGKVSYIVEHYKADENGIFSNRPSDRFILLGELGATVTAEPIDYEGYSFIESVSKTTGVLKEITVDKDILVLTLYYVVKAPDVPDTPDTPDTPDVPDTPDIPDTPDTPDVPGGDVNGDVNGGGNGNGSKPADKKHHIVFGKTDGIGWYRVSKDGGATYDIVFGNSTYEVEPGTEIIVKVGDLMGDSFRFYVNGDAVEPDENGNLVVTVNGYMLIGALGYKVEVPDTEESLNWFQKIIKAIKDFFARLFGKK